MVIASAGVGAWALRRSYREEERRQLAAGSGYDEDAEVALHVARHEALTRRHP